MSRFFSSSSLYSGLLSMYSRTSSSIFAAIRQAIAFAESGIIDDIKADIDNMKISANEELFQRMLENLINNSIRHNPDGCEISICVETDKTRSSRCVLQISDSGRGASAETLKTLNRNSVNRTGKLKIIDLLL